MLHSHTFDLKIIFAFHRAWDTPPCGVHNSGCVGSKRFPGLDALLSFCLEATGFGFLPNPNCSFVVQYVVSYWHIACCQCLCSFCLVSCHHPDLLHLVS